MNGRTRNGRIRKRMHEQWTHAKRTHEQWTHAVGTHAVRPYDDITAMATVRTAIGEFAIGDPWHQIVGDQICQRQSYPVCMAIALP